MEIIHVRNISVDSGYILISDMDIYQEEVNRDSKLYKVIKVDKGIYKVKVKCNDDEVKEGYIQIRSGYMVVSDPCYHIEDDREWDVFYGDLDPNSKDYLLLEVSDGTYKLVIEMG